MIDRFLGITQDTRNLFTYRVQLELHSDSKKGSEFTRNVVRTRNKEEILGNPEEELDLTQFRFQRIQQTKTQKRNREFVYELQDILEEEVEDTTERDNVEVENINAMEADMRSGTYTSNPVDIRKVTMLQNPGGETDVREVQSRTTAITQTI